MQFPEAWAFGTGYACQTYAGQRLISVVEVAEALPAVAGRSAR